MKKSIAISTAVLTAVTMSMTGCAPRIGGKNYSVAGTGEMSDTYPGVIISKEIVTIGAKRAERENEPGLGAGAGALAGGLGAGSAIGGGSGRLWAAGAGALVGGVAGHFAERALTDQEGFLYTVRLDNGKVQSLSQGAEPNMAIGQRILLITPSKPSGREAYTVGDVNLSRGRIVPDNSR